MKPSKSPNYWLAHERLSYPRLSSRHPARRSSAWAPDYKSGGQEFESLRARQWNQRFLGNIEIIPSRNSDLGRSWEGGEVSP